MNVLYVMGLLGVAVFAVTGALAAGRKQFDIFGVVVIAVVTAIGGGTVRDLLLDRNPVFWIEDTNYLIAATAAALLTVLMVRFRRPPVRLLSYADGLGLALFTIAGTRIADGAGVSPGVAVLMGCLTGVAGGVFRDVLSGEVPLLLRDRELYATPALLGATLYLVLLHYPGLPENHASYAGMAAVAGVRFFSIWWKWRMPVFRFAE